MTDGERKIPMVADKNIFDMAKWNKLIRDTGIRED